MVVGLGRRGGVYSNGGSCMVRVYNKKRTLNDHVSNIFSGCVHRWRHSDLRVDGPDRGPGLFCACARREYGGGQHCLHGTG